MDVAAKEYVATKDLEALTGISASTWSKCRLTGDAPPFFKEGKSVHYHVPTVREWIAGRQRRSTPEYTATAL